MYKPIKHFMLLGFLLFFFNSKAQNYASAIDAFLGATQDGTAAMLTYNYFIDRDDYIQSSIYISFNEDEQKNIKIPYNNFTLNVGYFFSVFKNIRKTFKINPGFGVLGGYEAINDGSLELPNGAIINDKSKFIYGLFGSLELEHSLGDGDFSVLLKYNQYYHVNSDLGNFIPSLGLGIRYYIF